ncbi:RND family efflux transporter, MFP subunit [Devosia lucknowensis]|uniref:RND family efflux transporter, MFP subunit n=1 Tax=Devosia lucknowensis TaxID=1096929 RepID=A0A1Y6G830_9HYPH|nr:efflux RND transporter periplasmic adaptor subunit [Devosia lucknowensis]SMQ86342.1 RND family efflux transporter, MFP subunit [Devosia lucknowensis]
MAKSETSPRPVTRRRKWRWGWIVLFLIVAGACAYALVERPWEPKPKAVATETIAPAPVTQVLAVNGRIAARKSVTIRSAVSAQALSVNADVGDVVEDGEVLVALDASVVQAQVQQARAALDAQQVKQRQAEATASRSQALGDNATRASREEAELALAATVNETARLQAALEQVERQVAQYSVQAPMSGVVLSRGFDQGQLVDTQTELFVIADTADLVVETDVDELYSSRVSTGLKAMLKPVGASIAQEGTVTFAAPTVDPSTGGRAIKITFDDQVTLPIGQTVNANVIVDEVPDALSVPRSAIITNGAQSHVLVVDGGVASERSIVFNDWPAERVIVTEGLSTGDVVIVDPTALKSGDLVTAE